MIRRGIDGRALTPRMGGMGRYVVELMHALDRELPGAMFTVYLRHADVTPAPSARWAFRVDGRSGASIPGPAWSRLRCAHLWKDDQLDVFWAAAGIAPAKPAGVPVVTTVFDLNHLVLPSSMPIATRIGHKLWMMRSLRESVRRVAISAGTAARVKAAYDMDCDAIARPGIGRHFLAHRSNAAAGGTRYVLSVATREPRKNLGGLIRAMAMLNATRVQPVELWLAGGRGWGNALSSEERRMLDQPWCRSLGYVPDADLPALYAKASAFAFPSLYEGYGIPVAEARSQGTPVVATDIPELREAGGDGAVYTGTSAEAICKGIELALSRPRGDTGTRAAVDQWEISGRVMADELMLAANSRVTRQTR
jgi:glycosyltransferase involved in cell wall biosynthesis